MCCDFNGVPEAVNISIMAIFPRKQHNALDSRFLPDEIYWEYRIEKYPLITCPANLEETQDDHSRCHNLWAFAEVNFLLMSHLVVRKKNTSKYDYIKLTVMYAQYGKTHLYNWLHYNTTNTSRILRFIMFNILASRWPFFLIFVTVAVLKHMAPYASKVHVR